jgi:hypothetical protein
MGLISDKKVLKGGRHTLNGYLRREGGKSIRRGKK